MKFHDTAIGAVLIAFGLWIVATAWQFPRLTGQPIGPGTFPVVLGSLCALGGAILAVQGLRSGVPLMQIHPGWRRPDRLLSALVLVGGTALLAMSFETIGFPIGGTLLVMAVFLTSGHRHPGWFALAFGFVFAVHILLTRFLLVPLPAGLLKGVL